MKTAAICDSITDFGRVYGENVIEYLRNNAGFDGVCYTKEQVLCDSHSFCDTEYIFSTWGMPVFSMDEIRNVFPSLKCVFYTAGTVQNFARPFLHSGVKVFSAWAANAVPVAEYTAAQIVLANKGFFKSSALASAGSYAEAAKEFKNYPGNYGAKVGIIGAGMIGKLVIKKLKDYDMSVLTFDPFLPDETAAELGAEKTTLERVFSECNVISNHLANNEQTRGMLNGALFERMKPYSTFLNTGRGAQVVEADLIKTLEQRPDITAILDVTDPEPPESGSKFYTLPNCILTPHIAGSSGSEVKRMSEYMLGEFIKYSNGEKTEYEVTRKMLDTMA